MKPFCVAMLLASVCFAAQAQDSSLSTARASFSECQRLLDKQQPCLALKSCEKGLAAKRLSVLEELHERAQTLCDLQKKPREKPCPRGMTRGPETEGRCCWPGQVWALPAGGDTTMCVGTPTECPQGYKEDPALATCRRTCDKEGRIETASGHCCWPGQAWSEELSSCVGLPLCPERYEVGLIERQSRSGQKQEVEECVYSDQDRDGLRDRGPNKDQCPALPEDMDGFEDDDGCPEPDNDGDGICDESWSQGSRQDQLLAANCNGSDACPMLPEDPDGYEDSDGCPDLDHDNDLICDPNPQGWSLDPSTSSEWGCTGLDLCVGEPETVNGFEDEDGCPDLTQEQMAALEAERAEQQAHLDFLQRLQTGGWVTLGTGTALVVTGIVLLVEARDLEVDLEPDEGEAITVIFDVNQTDTPEIRRDVDLLDGLGGAALGLGAAGILAGASLLIIEAIWSGSTDETPDTSARLFRGPNGTWGVVLQGAF